MYNVMVKWLTSLRESVMLDTVSPEPEVTKSLPWSRWRRERRSLAVWHMADILCVGFATRWCSAAGPRGGEPAGEARQAVDWPLWNPCSGCIEGSLHYSFYFCSCFVIFTTKRKTDKTVRLLRTLSSCQRGEMGALCPRKATAGADVLSSLVLWATGESQPCSATFKVIFYPSPILIWWIHGELI